MVDGLLAASAALYVFATGVMLWLVMKGTPRFGLDVRVWQFPPAARAPATALCAIGVGYLFYRAAIEAYGGVAERVIRLIDLRRLSVLKVFGFGMPLTVGDERTMMIQLQQFFAQEELIPDNRPLVDPAASLPNTPPSGVCHPSQEATTQGTEPTG